MKPSCHKPAKVRNDRGYFLLELLVYIGLLAVILNLAYAAFWRCLDNSKRLHQNADAILGAVEAGERWREDVRLARSAAVNADTVKMIQPGDEVEYRFEQQAIWRHSTRDGRTICLLSNVKSSAMQPDPRQEVAAWRWELELQTGKKPPFLRPLFTFEAVPAAP